MRLGVVILPELRWPSARQRWQRAEALGFEHAWTFDHLAWRSMRDRPWFGAVPTLTAAAAATERIRLGPLVASPNFRHPVPFAKELVTLDDVSDGRLILGLGAGGLGWDATILGQRPWSTLERADRFAEFVDLTDQLLREPATSYRGRYYAADEARTYPGCVQQPRVPFAIAATGGRGMRLAATHAELWVTTGGPRGEDPLPAAAGARAIRAQLDRLDAACAAAGRDPRSLRRLLLAGQAVDSGLASVDAFHETIGRYAEAGVTDFVVPWPRPDEPFVGNLETFERVVTS
jgi:alkanesulfonate monooxygenase SsuD/methylene tetrahydromethanopterin reductase-like flavin-dependent oxidoreductase (luciferase family)